MPYTYFVDHRYGGDWHIVEDSVSLARAREVRAEILKDDPDAQVEIWCKETDTIV